AVVPVAVATALLGVLLAVTVMTNTWDAPSLWLLIAAILTVELFGSQQELRGAEEPVAATLTCQPLALTLSIAVLVALIAGVALAPHLSTFEMPVGAVRDPNAFYLIGPVKWLELKRLSEFKDYFVHFGFFLIPLTIAIHGRLIGRIGLIGPIGPIGPIEKNKQTRRTAIAIPGLAYLAALYVFLFAHRYFLLYYLSLMIASALVLLVLELYNTGTSNGRAERQESSIFAAVGLLSAVAFALSLFAELWVMDDGYSGHLERYNTVFKTYNIAWLLYGLSTAAAAVWLLPRPTEDWRGMLRIRFLAPWLAAAAIVVMGFTYPYAATVARVRELQWRTQSRGRVALPVASALDAIRYYASVNRDEYALIEWIAETISGRPVVAEGCRDKDSYSIQSRIATFTGLPTVVAWPQHEANWRSYVPSPSPSSERGVAKVRIWDEMAQRIADLRALYTTSDDRLVRAVAERYRIDYIVIGRWERALYGADAGQRLRTLLKPVFEGPSGETVLLKTDRESWAAAP
ncbi:hypothetical protein FJY63_06555, partial [Candidatus Sumerlaeota bacterium]|nr:hypothetical protein [Candidatus Sumerlaeota bacterium]